MNFIRKHQKAVIITGLAVLLFGGLGYWLRLQSINNSTSTKLEDVPRKSGKAASTFYYGQLTPKESEAYDLMKAKLDNMEGGVIEYAKALSGPEYLRVTTALEDEGYNYFYGFYDIPMTEDNVYVKYKNVDLTTMKEEKIAKAILFLSCAEGINEFGEYGEDGTVLNLDEIQDGLSVNSEEKLKGVVKSQEDTEEILNQIMEGLPSDYGEKAAADYFLEWLEDNMELADDVGQEAASFKDMEDVFEGAYAYNNLSALVGKKATALGYAKIMSELCNRAGMESHVVLGTWNKNRITKSGYVFCAVSMNGQTIYIDPSGAKGSEMGGQKYLNKQEAKNHMQFVEYFEYE